MNDERWLRDRLGAAVPEAPPSPDRAASARDRHRQAVRRAAAVAAMAAVVLVAAVVTPLALARGGGSADRGVSPALTGAATSPTRCPSKPVSPADLSGSGTLPDGATSARLCQGPGAGIQPPVDALAGSAVQTLVGLIDRQPTQPTNEACTDELGPGYAIVFGYPDGSTRTVTGEDYGCGDLQVGDTVRDGAHAVFGAFITALSAQRTGETPPGSGLRPTCAPSAYSPTGQPAGMTSAVLCVSYATHTEQTAPAVPIAASDLQVLLTDWTARANTLTHPPHCHNSSDANWRIDGVTGWGERVAIWGDCNDLTDNEGHYYPLSEHGRQILTRLLGEAGSPRFGVTPASTPADVVDTFADMVANGDLSGACALFVDCNRLLDHPEIRVGWKFIRNTATDTSSWAMGTNAFRFKASVVGIMQVTGWHDPELPFGDWQTVTIDLVRATTDEPWKILGQSQS